MPLAAERLEFAPPPQPGLLRGLGLAILAHLLLVLALTFGLQWDRDATLSAEAELWSAVPQEAAPKEVAPVPRPAPRKEVVREEPKPEPVKREVDIALEREKQKKLEAKRKEEELAKAAAEKRREQEEKKRRQKEEEAEKLTKLREENLRRIQSMAGTGAPTATGTAARSSGPSDSYGGRIRARVKPNIVFSDDIPGNPTAEVEVRMAPDGTIVSRKVVKSSGHPSWDDAVLRALDKTEVLPRDLDGRVHTPLLLAFRPRD